MVASGTLKAEELKEKLPTADGDEPLRKRKRSMGASHLSSFTRNFGDLAHSSSSEAHPGRHSAPPLPTKDSDIQDIYFHFIKALVGSISYHLTIRRKHLPLGAGILVFGNFAELDHQDAIAAVLAEPAFGSLYFLAASWQPDGYLLILSHRSTEAVSPASISGSDFTVLLAPFGWRGVVRHFSADDLHPAGEDEWQSKSAPPAGWRKSCLNLLQWCGITVPKESAWLTVVLYQDSNFSESFLIEWPALLCFRPCTQLGERRPDLHQDDSSIQHLADPLAAAEDWFLNHEIRENQIREQVRARKMKEEQGDADLSEDEDVPEGLQTSSNDPNEVQNVSGIYPTPPDGYRSQARSAATPRTETVHDQNEALPAAAAKTAEQLRMDEAGDDPPSTAEANLGSYDHLEDDDLFQDMQSQIYTNNEITEDDFSFFDKPDEELLSPTGEFVTSPPTKSELQLKSHVSPDILSNIIPSTMKDDIELLLSKKSPASLHPEDIEPESMKDVPMESPKDTAGNKIFQPIEAHENEGAFTKDEVHYAEKRPEIMDDKYKATGKFAVTPINPPRSSKPDVTPKMDKTIPKIQDDSYATNIPMARLNEHSSASKERSTGQAKIDARRHTDQSGSSHSGLDRISPPLTPHYSFPLKALLQFSGPPLSEVFEGRMTSSHTRSTETETQSTDTIQLAQIVSDQYIHYESFLKDTSFHNAQSAKRGTLVTNYGLEHVISSILPQMHRCTLQEFAILGHDDGPPVQNPQKTTGRSVSKKSENARGPPSPTGRAIGCASLLRTPDVLVKRGESLMEVSATALEFWKELGLGPVHGSKDISAFCLCPDNEVLRCGAQSLLEAVGQTYLSLRLGTHTAGHPTLEDYASGIVTFPTYHSASAALESIKALCEQFGTSDVLS